MAKKKKKINLIKLGIASLITVLVLGYSAWGIINLIKNPTDTFMVEDGKLSLEETVEGCILREEQVVQGQNQNNGIFKIKDEGEKVAKGERIFRYQSAQEEELNKKIEELDKKIEDALANEIDMFPADITLLENQIHI